MYGDNIFIDNGYDILIRIAHDMYGTTISYFTDNKKSTPISCNKLLITIIYFFLCFGFPFACNKLLMQHLTL